MRPRRSTRGVAGRSIPGVGSRPQVTRSAAPDALARVAAYAGVAGALGYAALKTSWALGGTVGVSDPAPWEDPPPGSPWAALDGSLLLRLAFEGTVVLALLAALVLLALVEPWGRRVPQRPLRALAWLGCGVLGAAVLGGAGGMLAEAVGLLAPDPDRYTPMSWFVGFGCFLPLAVAFGVTAWRSAGPSSSSSSSRRAGGRGVPPLPLDA